MNVAGKPAPLPDARPSGTTPPMTPSGAAAATTMNTIDGDAEIPAELTCRGRWLRPKASGVVVVSDIGNRPVGR